MSRLLKSPLAWLLVLLVATAAIYWPGLNGGFAFDDYPNIVFNEALRVRSLNWDEWMAATFSSMSSDLQRPLAMLSFATNCYFTALNPRPMKMTNIAIHLVNVALVFGLLRALLREYTPRLSNGNSAAGVAWMTTALWALAPINVMAVLFIVQRMESLSHTFVFAGLWLYVLGRQRQLAGEGGWLAILAGLFAFAVLGLLSKESAVLLPLYAFGIEACLFRFRGRDQRADRRLFWLYGLGLLLPALAGGIWLWQRSTQLGAFDSRNFDLTERLLTEFRVVFDYLHWTLSPDLGQLSLFHDDYPVSRSLWLPASTLPKALALAILAASALVLRKRRPLAALGIFWFFAAQALTATFLPLELVFEHRNYFASLGVMLALADLLLVVPQAGWRKVGLITAGLLLFWYASFTGLRAWEWANPLRFAVAEAAKHPLSPRATYHLGQTYVIAADGKNDSPFTNAAFAALEQARRVPNGNILPAQGLLMLASRMHRPLKEEWWREIEDRLRDHPIGPQERGALAALTECTGTGHCDFPADDMNRMFAVALSRGNDPEIINIYGSYALHVLDNPELALSLWRIAADLNPREAVYRASVIKMLIALQRYDEARSQIAVLRRMGRVGQNDRGADALEARIRAAGK